MNAEEASVGKRMPADKVVTLALKAVDTNRNYLITGCSNWLLGQLYRFVTRKRLLLIAEKYCVHDRLKQNRVISVQRIALKR